MALFKYARGLLNQTRTQPTTPVAVEAYLR